MQGLSCNWGCAEAGVTVYMYYVRLTVSLFWWVLFWVVTVCGGLFTLSGVVRLGGVTKLEDHLLKLALKEEKGILRLGSLGLALFLASMQTTAGVAKGVSRFSGT